MQLLQSYWNKHTFKIISGIFLAWLFSIVILMLWTGFWIGLWSQQLKSYQLQQARYGSIFLNLATFKRIPDLIILDTSLAIVNSTKHISQRIFESQKTNQIQLTGITEYLELSLKNIQKIIENLSKTSLLGMYVNTEIKQLLTEIESYLQIAIPLSEHSGEYIILFKNADELRATGGFMGSYARLSYQDATVYIQSVQDIYEPAGQFEGYIQAPPGVLEYLSSGKGLQLPDANWAADFPTAAQTILRFFSLGNEQKIVGVIAINSRIIEHLLTITGPIYLPDYKIEVTSKNFTEKARQDRAYFFPGSKQKTMFLNHFMTHLRIALLNLETDQITTLAKSIPQLVSQKKILMYHEHPNIQTYIERTPLAGSITISPKTEFFLFPVESNVGINKANSKIHRSFKLQIGADKSTLRMSLLNTHAPNTAPHITNPHVAAANHLHYVNYQRVYVLPDVQVNSITQNQTPIEQWKERIIFTHSGDQLKEIGFLSITEESSSSVIDIDFSHPNELSSVTQLQIMIQPGLPETTIDIVSSQDQKSYIFMSDLITQLAL